MATTERRWLVSTASLPDGKNPELGALIEKLGPLNNRWRTSPPSEKVSLLWAMGDVLLMAHPKPADSLLWEIQRRSYITRVVLRYALIVRRSWPIRDDLEELTRGLKSYTVFREALPFLKGNREGIDGPTHTRVLALLRSANTQNAVQEIKDLKARTIGRRHKKGASVAAVRDLALNFSQALDQLELEVVSGARTDLSETSETLSLLSGLAVAVAAVEGADNLRQLKLTGPVLQGLAEPLVFVIRSGPAAISAFRRTVGSRRLMEAADLLNSSRSEHDLNQWRKRHSHIGGTQLKIGGESK
jgi:hypothetical protein